MILCEVSSTSLPENLAIDEALLSASQELSPNDLCECLRLWEFPEICVVMGRGSKQEEVNVANCQSDNISILRRCSGGAPIVAGPGCLMFSLILSLNRRPTLRSIDVAHQAIMSKIARAVQSVITPTIHIQGSCDLTIENRKFSGNAVRYNRDWILYHGTLLYQFSLQTISQYLNMPIRQPDYRSKRSHDQFLTNIPCDRVNLEKAITAEWEATEKFVGSSLQSPTLKITQQLLQTKYQ